MAAGRGCILALPHLGGWEWAGVWLIQLGFPMTVVVEALEPPELFEWFVDLPAPPRHGGGPVGPAAGATVLRALKANHVVCLLCDRNVGGSAGVEVEFFGERTDAAGRPGDAGAAHRRAAAARRPCTSARTAECPPAVVRPPLPADPQRHPARTTSPGSPRSLAGELEVLIRRAPTQWHLLQPNWPSDGDQGPGGSGEVP